VRGRRRKSSRVNGLGPRLTKGAKDDVSLCVLSCSGSDGEQKDVYTDNHLGISACPLTLWARMTKIDGAR